MIEALMECQRNFFSSFFCNPDKYYLLALSLLYNWVHVTEGIRMSPLEPILINYFLIVSFLEFKWFQLSFPSEKFLRAREYQRVKLSLGPTLRFRDLPANYLSCSYLHTGTPYYTWYCFNNFFSPLQNHQEVQANPKGCCTKNILIPMGKKRINIVGCTI